MRGRYGPAMPELRCATCDRLIVDGDPLAMVFAAGELSHHHPTAPCVVAATVRATTPCSRCGRTRFLAGPKGSGGSVPRMCPPCRTATTEQMREPRPRPAGLSSHARRTARLIAEERIAR